MHQIAYLNSRGRNPNTGVGSYRRNLLNALYNCSGETIVVDEFRVHGKRSKIRKSLVSDFESYDLVHLEPDPHWYPGILFRRFKNQGPKIGMTVHGSGPILFKQETPLRQRLRLEKVIKRLTPILDGIFTVSDTERHLISNIINYPVEDIYVTYNGNNYDNPSCADVRANPLHDQDFLLHVSNDPNWQKNPTLLLDAFKKITQLDQNTDLVLVGEGWDSDEIRSLITERGLEDRTVAAGKVPSEELIRLYAHAELYVQTSVYETFCMPVVEAMSFGTPVVTTTAYALPEIAGDAAMYVDRIPEQIANVIIELLDDADLYQEKSQKALRRSERYTWERSAEATLNGYKCILSEDTNAY